MHDAYLKISDLEEQIRLLNEGHHYKEQILRKQIKRLKNELGITPILEGSITPITIHLTRDKGTFGFKLLGRKEVKSLCILYLVRNVQCAMCTLCIVCCEWWSVHYVQFFYNTLFNIHVCSHFRTFSYILSNV